MIVSETNSFPSSEARRTSIDSDFRIDARLDFHQTRVSSDLSKFKAILRKYVYKIDLDSLKLKKNRYIKIKLTEIKNNTMVITIINCKIRIWIENYDGNDKFSMLQIENKTRKNTLFFFTRTR